MDYIVMVGQFILAIIIMVGLHEAGHFMAAKAFGMRVEKFFIGIPPKIFSFKKGDTEYGLGSIPLGGFVKISGMIDESMDTEALSKDPEPWEFRAKPAWQRLIVMLGGIIMNILTAIIVFSCLLFINGKTVIPAEEVMKYGIHTYEYAQKKMGLQDGDKIVSVNGEPVKNWGDFMNREILFGENNFYLVERDGQLLDTVWLPDDFLEFITGDEPFIDPITPFFIEKVDEGKPAEKAGVLAGDKIIKMDTVPIRFVHEMIATTKSYKGKTVSLTILRDDLEVETKVTIDTSGKIGVTLGDTFERDTIQFSFFGAIAKGTSEAFNTFFDNIRGLSKVFTGKIPAKKAVSGPLGIMKKFGVNYNAIRFWGLIAFISMALAFMNLLPIPGLDGGHVVFLVYEMVSGKKPSDKFMEWAIKIGLLLILSLIIFSFYVDIFER